MVFVNDSPALAIGIDWHAVQRYHSEILRQTVPKHLQIQISDCGSVQDAPELLFAGFSLDYRMLIIWVRHRDKIYGKVFRRFAGARAGVSRIAIRIEDSRGRGCAVLRGGGVWIPELVRGNVDGAFRPARQCRIRTFNSFD